MNEQKKEMNEHWWRAQRMHCQCIGVPSKYLLQSLHDLLEGGLQLLGHSPFHCRQLAERVVFLHPHTASLCTGLNMPHAAMHALLWIYKLLICNLESACNL